MGTENKVGKCEISHCQEKPLSNLYTRTKTDTGRREENSKTRGRTIVKELGKMTP